MAASSRCTCARPSAAPSLHAVENVLIAERLEAFAALLDLAEANPYSARAYRRAAETIRATPVPVADLVRTGRVRNLRGIGRSIEGKLRDIDQAVKDDDADTVKSLVDDIESELAQAAQQGNLSQPGAASLADPLGTLRQAAGAYQP